MDYRKEKGAVYLRVDKGEEVLAAIKEVCQKEKIEGGYFQGIGACGQTVLSTWIPEREDFIQHNLSGMLEMISLMGNLSVDGKGESFSHSHAIFSYLKEDGEIGIIAGHLESAEISYTGEIIIVPAQEKIGRVFDEKAGIEVWSL